MAETFQSAKVQKTEIASDASASPDVSGARVVNVESRKLDGRVHRRWSAQMLEQNDSLIVLDGIFESEVRHKLLGTIVCGTRSIEFYWTNRFYNVFRFHEPDGRLRNFYCNISLPPVFDGSNLHFVDLDIDVLVAPDLSFRVLDRDEFTVNAARFDYSDEVRANVFVALDDLKTLIAARVFPFDFKD